MFPQADQRFFAEFSVLLIVTRSFAQLFADDLVWLFN